MRRFAIMLNGTLAGVTVTLFLLLWLAHAPPTLIEHIRLNDYDLAVPTPVSWSLRTTDNGGVVLERHGAFVTLDWYSPASDDRYENFDRRVRAEIRRREHDGTDVHTQRYHVGSLRAVEVRSLDKDKNVFAETFLDVPAEPSGGELFVITLQGRSGKAGAADLQAYHDVLRSLRVTHHAE